MPFPGDKFKPSADRERQITKLLESARGERASFGVPGPDKLGPGQAYAKNETGSDLAFLKPAFLTNQGFVNTERVPRVDPDARKGRYTLRAWTPVVDDMRVNRMAVTLEPIKNNAIGLVTIAGLTVCDGANGPGYIAPSGTGTSAGMFGFAKVLSSPAGGGFGVVDLSDTCNLSVYTITAITSGSRTITASFYVTPATYSTIIYDAYNIAGWQVVGDQGIAHWTGSQWHILHPWCVGT